MLRIETKAIERALFAKYRIIQGLIVARMLDT